ncbi:MAG: JAB domain-containing protein [Candidatus Cloacimonadota bacterium]|nr:MAG: JAB domain-containing protein [Candidatus Cloacimonadota bacterium]
MSEAYKMKDIPQEERPRERLIKDGPDTLKNHELIAVILGKGSRKEGVLSIARRIMDDYGTKSLSGEKDVKRLTETLNLTEIQACQIIAALELGRRLFGKARKETFLNSPGDVFSYLTNIGKLEKEVMHGLYLDVKNKLLRDEVISVGTVSCSLVHPREVYKPALIYSAVGVILVHNHPSGDPEPSKEDIALTKRLKKVSEYIDIELLDHIIIGNDDYISMKSKGLI